MQMETSQVRNIASKAEISPYRYRRIKEKFSSALSPEDWVDPQKVAAFSDYLSDVLKYFAGISKETLKEKHGIEIFDPYFRDDNYKTSAIKTQNLNFKQKIKDQTDLFDDFFEQFNDMFYYYKGQFVQRDDFKNNQYERILNQQTDIQRNVPEDQMEEFIKNKDQILKDVDDGISKEIAKREKILEELRDKISTAKEMGVQGLNDLDAKIKAMEKDIAGMQQIREERSIASDAGISVQRYRYLKQVYTNAEEFQDEGYKLVENVKKLNERLGGLEEPDLTSHSQRYSKEVHDIRTRGEFHDPKRDYNTAANNDESNPAIERPGVCCGWNG